MEFCSVMPGLAPGVRVFLTPPRQDVDGRAMTKNSDLQKKVIPACQTGLIFSRLLPTERRCHDAPRRRRAGRRGRRSGRAFRGGCWREPVSAGGAPGGAASGRWVSHTRHCGTRAPRDGLRNPILFGALGAPIARGAPRGLANPWRLPALHFPLSRGTEKRERE